MASDQIAALASRSLDLDEQIRRLVAERDRVDEQVVKLRSDSATPAFTGASDHHDLADLSMSLPTGRDVASRKRRSAMFDKFDVNGNGYLSLAECDKAVRDVLGSHELFSSKPVIMRAFQAAKDASKGTTGSRVGKNFVEHSEFRLLLVYLRQYFELYKAYSQLDSSDDRRLSLPEFRAGLSLLSRWGVSVSEEAVEAEFAAIDTNGGGQILFDEFCDWALRRQLDIEGSSDIEAEEPAARLPHTVADSEFKTAAGQAAATRAAAASGTARPSWTERAAARANVDIPHSRPPRRSAGAATTARAGELADDPVNQSFDPSASFRSARGSQHRSPAATKGFSACIRSGGGTRPSSAAGYRPPSGGSRAERAAAAAAAATAALEARGANPRLPLDRPLEAHQSALLQPLGPGPMPTRPPITRNRPNTSGRPLSPAASSVDTGVPRSPAEVVAATRPRVVGGAFPKAVRHVNNPTSTHVAPVHDPFMHGGGKAVGAGTFPWAGNSEGVFPHPRPLQSVAGQPKARSDARMYDAAARSAVLHDEFVIDSTLRATFI